MRLKLLTLLLLAVFCLTAVACRREQPQQQAGQCPKLDGSYFGSDKSAVRKGESITLSLKVPRQYQWQIEGLENSASSVRAGQSSQLYDKDNPPAFIEQTVPDVRLEKTTTFILRGAGPAGCEPLELPAKVTVNE